jgi:hypothetical protein
MLAAHRQALATAGVEDHPAKLLACLRWCALRVAGSLRESAEGTTTGPIVLAAAHAAEGLWGLCASGQHPESADPGALTTELETARQALTTTIVNIDIMLRLVKQGEDLFR